MDWKARRPTRGQRKMAATAGTVRGHGMRFRAGIKGSIARRAGRRHGGRRGAGPEGVGSWAC